jgi:hypothetical protein
MDDTGRGSDTRKRPSMTLVAVTQVASESSADRSVAGELAAVDVQDLAGDEWR